jgi:hypothetical protein
MKLFAHVGMDGQIRGLVAIQEGVTNAMLSPQPGTQVCEIEDHGLKDEAINPEMLGKLIEQNTVDFTSPRGKLVRRTG